MKIGNYELYAIEAGRFRLDGGAVFGLIPKSSWQKKIPSDEYNRIELALRCLLIKGRNKNILVDCGIGNKLDRNISVNYALDYSQSNLSTSLKQLNMTYDDITHVILSHLHFDHTGAATCFDQYNRLTASFPNARYYVQRKNLEHAFNPSDRDKKTFLKENISPLIDQKKLKIISGGMELFSNIDLIVCHGHTIAQQIVKISQKNQSLIYCGDVIPTTAHIAPHWLMAYDNNPLISLQEKKTILAQALEKNSILFFCHDPAIEACSIKLTDKGYQLKEQIILSDF